MIGRPHVRETVQKMMEHLQKLSDMLRAPGGHCAPDIGDDHIPHDVRAVKPLREVLRKAARHDLRHMLG